MESKIKLTLENKDGTMEIQMEWDDWFAKYQPVMLEPYMDDGEPMEFDTCQEAADYIKEHMPEVPEEDRCKHVWTETGGDGWYYVSTGYHVVDRMHCFVCKVPWTTLYEACMYDGSMDNYVETISEDCYDDDVE